MIRQAAIVVHNSIHGLCSCHVYCQVPYRGKGVALSVRCGGFLGARVQLVRQMLVKIEILTSSFLVHVRFALRFAFSVAATHVAVCSRVLVANDGGWVCSNRRCRYLAYR